MTAVTAEQAWRYMACDPQVTRLADQRRRWDERQHVAMIVGELGDQSGVPAIELPFAGGTFRFRLTELELVLLELGYAHPLSKDDVKAPAMRVGEAYARLLRGRYQVDGKDVGLPGAADFSVIEMNALIRMALLGGGGGTVDGQAVSWKAHDVDAYMRQHVYPLPLVERWNLAVSVLGVRMEGEATPEADG